MIFFTLTLSWLPTQNIDVVRSDGSLFIILKQIFIKHICNNWLNGSNIIMGKHHYFENDECH